MHGPGNQLLAGTGLALNQYGRVGWRDLANALEKSLHGVTGADDTHILATTIGAGRGGLGRRLWRRSRAALLLALVAGGNNALHGFNHFVMVERLGDVVDSAELHRVDRRAQAGVAGHDQHGRVRRTADEFGAGLARQAQVADDQLEALEIVSLDGLADRAGLLYLVVVALQQPFQCRTDDGFVFNNQNV